MLCGRFGWDLKYYADVVRQVRPGSAVLSRCAAGSARVCSITPMLCGRFGRGLKTLDELLRKARAGRAVSEEDIPPPVYTAAAHSTPAAPAPAPEQQTDTPTATDERELPERPADVHTYRMACING